MSLSLFHSIFVVQHLHYRLLGALHTKERSKPFETNHFVPINQRSNFFGSCRATTEDNRMTEFPASSIYLNILSYCSDVRNL